MGRFLLGAGVLRLVGPMDREAAPRSHRRSRRTMGRFDLSDRMVRTGPAVSVLATDFHPAAALLDRLSSASFIRPDVPLIRLAALAGRSCAVDKRRAFRATLGRG